MGSWQRETPSDDVAVHRVGVMYANRYVACQLPSGPVSEQNGGSGR